MEFRILGPLEVSDGERPLRLAGAKQRALLALLLLRANEVVSSDRLIDELWGEEVPEKAANALQARVSQLRKALGPAPGEILLTRSPGYLLRVEPGELDAERFERLAEEGRRALALGDPGGAARMLRDALALWRGPALADFAYEPFAQGEIARLEEARLAALEERLEADLALGRHGELVGELEALITAHPLRERLRGQLMLALYRSGRQAEALAAYQETRRILIEELGIEPSLPLRELHAAILNQDAGLERAAEPKPPRAEPSAPTLLVAPGPAREVRKTVTVLVSDRGRLLGQAPDPEAHRRAAELHLETVSSGLERHGGAVHGLHGQQVLAVFGIPLAHEDDALRAVRAAAELDDASAIGIATGEVLAGEEASGQAVVTGEAVGVAARLAQAAATGEILIDEATRRLVQDAVHVDPADMAPDGSVWRLRELLPGAPAFVRHFEAPLVGREGELAQVLQSFARVVEERTSCLFTLLGPAGIGKSRLAQELAAALAEEATVLTGRCLSYGEGITFWPLKEVAALAFGGDVREEILELLRGEGDAELVADRVGAAIGLLEDSGPREEIFWAFRRLFEALARERPLLLVFEDIHWAEPTLLDLLEYLAGLIREAPVLLLCLARPELLDERPAWGGGKLNATSLYLEPLAERESEALIENLAGEAGLTGATRARIRETAEGNPLFLEQMLAMLIEEEAGDRVVSVPPTIQVLLAARLDRLGPGERAVLERASVMGREFWKGAVVDLLPEEARPSATRHLDALVRKELLRPDRSGVPGEEAFRFRHVLIQHATYRAISKALRGELHERFAAWLERTAGERVAEYEEILGYHLEQAFRYRAELGPVDGHGRELARRAAERLAAGGRRALRRGDMPATVNLLDRALSLFAADDRARVQLLPDLSFALMQVGEPERADSVLIEAIEGARAAGDRALEWHAIVGRTHSQLYARPGWRSPEEVLAEAHEAVAVFEELGDDLGLARALRLVSDAHALSGRAAKAAEVAERAAEHARRAGSHREEAWALEVFGWAQFYGPTPVAEAIRQRELRLEQAQGDREAEVVAARQLAQLRAMLGRFAEAREEMVRSDIRTRDLGLKWSSGWMGPHFAYIEMLADDPVAAERLSRAAFELASDGGDRWLSAYASVELARALYVQGRYEESAQLTEVFDEVAPDMQVKRQGVRAKLAARRGELERAETLAREAVSLAEQTDFLLFHADALLDLAEVLRLAGRPEEAAAAAAQEAVRLYEQKGAVVAAARAQVLITELREDSVTERRSS